MCDPTVSTPEEEAFWRKHDPPGVASDDGVRFGATMIPDWQTNFVALSGRLPRYQRKFFDEVTNILELENIPWELIEGTNYIWARDYMPVQVGENSYVQFTYNPDYLQHLPGYITGPIRLPWMSEYVKSPIVLDGGNLCTNGADVLMTDKVYRENHGESKAEIDAEISILLNVQLLTVPTQPGDGVGHVDGSMTFLDAENVLLSDYSEIAPGFDEDMREKLKRFEVHTLPHYEVIRWLKFRSSAAGCYSNYLRVGDVVLFPTFDHAMDAPAFETIKALLPQCRVYQVYSGKICRRGGLLHCATVNYKR